MVGKQVDSHCPNCSRGAAHGLVEQCLCVRLCVHMLPCVCDQGVPTKRELGSQWNYFK